MLHHKELWTVCKTHNPGSPYRDIPYREIPKPIQSTCTCTIIIIILTCIIIMNFIAKTDQNMKKE